MESSTIPLNSPLELTLELTDEQFFQLCQENRDLKFERTANGELIIMPPTGSETGNTNLMGRCTYSDPPKSPLIRGVGVDFDWTLVPPLRRGVRGDRILCSFIKNWYNCNSGLNFQLTAWSSQNNLGVVFDSSSGFKLPDGSDISPDAAWVRRDRWDALTPEQKEKFAPICPDFVVELREAKLSRRESASDSLEKLRAKMKVYIKNGAKLGWLLDRKNRQVEISRQGSDVEILSSPATLSGEDVLPGFVLDLSDIL
ncbi:MAG: Uma2 family endonuclease [Microcoleus sp.]